MTSQTSRFFPPAGSLVFVRKHTPAQREGRIQHYLYSYFVGFLHFKFCQYLSFFLSFFLRDGKGNSAPGILHVTFCQEGFSFFHSFFLRDWRNSTRVKFCPEVFFHFPLFFSYIYSCTLGACLEISSGVKPLLFPPPGEKNACFFLIFQGCNTRRKRNDT